MERNIERNGLINLLVMLAVTVATFAAARYSHSLAGQVGFIFLGLGALVSAVSWFQMRLERSERLERMEFEELAKGHGGAALFESKDAEVFPAQRSREQFERFFVPVFTVLVCLVQAGGAYFMWRWLSRNSPPQSLVQPFQSLGMFAVLFLVQFLLGKFSATIARLENQRLLRPSASCLLLGAYLCAAIAIGIAAVQADFRSADLILAYILTGLLALVAVETAVALLLEIYRPRIKGKIPRPLYESRLVGLLGQPEGLITTAAQALDYQFGFKVSDTWFYRFFERALGWLILLQVAILVLSSGVVVIQPGEQALLERFGRPVEGRPLLGPGAHLKWPAPIDKIYRFETDRIQTFDVGFTPDAERDHEKVVLWTVAHTKEENFLVANRETGSLQETNASGEKRIPPVSLLTVSIPVQYQVTDLNAWAYNNKDAAKLLESLATREVVRYLAGVDLGDILSKGREQASSALAAAMQAAADQRQLGARIISVGLQDLHPPVKVAPDYEKVVGAVQNREAKILRARAYEIRTNALARAQAARIVNTAAAEGVNRQLGAMAQASLFTNQIPAFQNAPSVYLERAYLQAFVRATDKARKYLFLTTNTQDVITFDLQDKIREDLLNLSVPPVSPKP